MKKEFIKLSGILCAITLIAALLLAGVNKLTAPKIAEAEEKVAKEARKSILREAEDFEMIDENVFEGKKDGITVGYCVKVTATGYGGDIEMMVAFDMEEKVCGIEILSHSETAGLGAKATDKEFKDQFKGKNSALTVTKDKMAGADQVVAITGATITSRAVAEEGVGKARAMLEDIYAKAKIEKSRQAMKQLLPEATDFEQGDENIYLAEKDDDLVGVCVHFALVGSVNRSRTEVIVGYNIEGEVAGVILLEQSDGYESYETLPQDIKDAVIENSDILLLRYLDRQEAGTDAEND